MLYGPALRVTVLAALCCVGLVSADESKPSATEVDAKISYYKQVRPIFQAQCQGCHQPAKPEGRYVMTSFDKLMTGGESGDKAILPGKPDESNLLDLITPSDGKAEMPQGKPPLSATEVRLIRDWIAQGAADDTPANARQRFDKDHPPLYTRQPVVASLDFSPAGELLAVAGFHEVLLHKADGSELVARLVGMSERIESVRFSPDGKRLAVTGGLPGRMGEVQVWDVEQRSLTLSAPVTFDTVYGGSWSPDGKLIAFGCADNSVRAIDSRTGDQVLYQGAHDDWALDTVFSADGKHLVSVGRDMSTKLTEVATQRFVDNVTSITPGALKGGIRSLARHPQRDEIVIGGSDGVPKVYRIFRQTGRVIGDDANLIRRLPEMKGRVFSAAVSRDGKRIAAASSLDGTGEVNVYAYEFDTSLPDNIKAAMSKVVGTRSAEEEAALQKYWTEGVKLISHVVVPTAGMYAVAFHPDNHTVGAAGADGTVRLINGENGSIVKEFAPAPLTQAAPAVVAAAAPSATEAAASTLAPEALPPGAKLAALEIAPAVISLTGRFDYAQLLVIGRLDSGERVDVTRLVSCQLSQPVVEISRTGFLRPLADGQAILAVTLNDVSANVAINVGHVASEFRADFIRDVNPVLTRLGCNQGTCHGAAKGKNGFKLSLRGYDAILDVRGLTDDLASRRVNVASPDDTLMLLKPTGAVPHVGGQLTRPGESYYELIRNWIAGGAKLDLNTPRVTGIEVAPANPIIPQVGGKQQFRVMATYADSRVRDVTRDAFIDSGNTEVAESARGGLMTAVRRGEAPILARFEGAYAATTLTVMGDRSGFVWQPPPVNNRIDELTAAKWQRMKIQPSALCTDNEFLRRAYLDLVGLPPTADEVRKFLADGRETRVRRDELIDRLIGSEDYIDRWTNKWADLLQVNRKFLGADGTRAYRKWIREELAANTPYDAFVRKILTATGSNRENPPASYFKILRTPTEAMETTTHLFLAVRFNCNKCHDHPFERWTQDQYYQTASYFAQVGLQRDPAGGNGNLGGTDVEAAKPLYEVVSDTGQGEVKHDRTGAVAPPQFPYPVASQTPDKAARRLQLATWLTSPDNRYFAKSYVNRLWGYLFGIGVIDPIDDIRAGNPPSNPQLLDYLTEEFVHSGFDVRHVMRLICKSRTYQLSVETNAWNQDDKINYAHAMARRLPAEVMYDAVLRATGSSSRLPGGSRAMALPDGDIDLPGGFLNTFGRPPRDSACECERVNDLQLGPVMALISGPAISDAIGDPGNELAKLVASQPDDKQLINEIFIRIINRAATEREIQAVLDTMNAMTADHQQLETAVKEWQQKAAEVRADLDRKREAAIAKAKDALAAYDKELAPKLAEQEKQRTGRTAKLTQELQQYEATLPAKLAAWEQQQQSLASQWMPLDPSDLKATHGAVLTKEADLSVLVTGPNGQGVYTFVAETPLKGITAIRLEALADARLPGNGPGRSPNGNFVLSEFEVTAAPKPHPEAAKKVELQAALADFSQESYDVKTAIDGQAPENNNGWAIHPKTGVTHWATFETKQDLGFDEGTVLTLTLNQRFADKMHTLGRFRISITTAKRPVGLGVPKEISDLVAIPAAQRNKEQQDRLLALFRERDEELRKQTAAVAESNKPLPPDPQQQQFQQKVEEASRPVPEDAKLAGMRRDLEMSATQLANKRLTAAQDLTWALINSPAFLFNH